ncbi:hypothetical protein LQ226_13475 [Pontibacillus sp. HN14]|nr:hypothetical protein [Pontibacillus sp. HN14]
MCGWLVYEDEQTWYNDSLKHSTCKSKPQLKQENERLKEELAEYRKWFGQMKMTGWEEGAKKLQKETK